MAKTRRNIEAINSLAELERIQWVYTPSGNNEILLKCPVHEDARPSVNLNTEKNLWKCHACGAKGDIVSFLAHAAHSSRSAIFTDLEKRYKLSVVKCVKPEIVEKYHAKIWSSGPLLQALRDRGVTDALIRKARLGFHDGRITIPIYNEEGQVINIRKYLPGAPGSLKFRNTTGFSGLFLYQEQQTKYATIWICGGELKALVAASFLNSENVGAVAVTAGEGSWDAKFNPRFKDKIVFVCMDIDSSGVTGAKKVASQLVYVASSIYIITLPLDTTNFPKGDINDWVNNGAKTEDFAAVMKTATKYTPTYEKDEVTEIVEVSLSEASSAKCLGKRVVIEGIVGALDTVPFLVPKTVGVDCTKDQPNCFSCPVKVRDVNDNGRVPMTIKGTSQGLLSLINTAKKGQNEGIRDALHIPGCKTVQFEVSDHYTVLDSRLTPQLSVTETNTDFVVQPAFLVSSRQVELNSPYTFTGRTFPHPKNQQAVLLIDSLEEGEDCLSSLRLKDLNGLAVFRPKKWTEEALSVKLDEIYADFAANVTQIYRRPELHLALDLTYHSCLQFSFDGRRQNGWVNTLILGDSSQGKSEASIQLMRHFRLGTRHDCKNATTAGLLGGLQQLGNKWFVSWGIIPVHDRRLVILEEVKGANPEVIGKLTDMRSSGIAELSMIEKRKAHARTRLVMISNPRSDRTISAFGFGIEAIKELIGALEDIRRFDLAIILAASQVDPKEINQLTTNRPKCEHIYTSALCHKLVLWAWTRSLEQVQFESAATERCLTESISLCEQYTEAMPLIDRGTTRYKLARLAIALAARTFSCVKGDTSSLLVRECHVAFIVKMLSDLYSAPGFGYKDFSSAQTFADTLIDQDLIVGALKGTKHPKDLVEHLLHADEITLVDICDWCEVEGDTARILLSLLVRKHALYRVKRWYVKTSQFIVLLKSLQLTTTVHSREDLF